MGTPMTIKRKIVFVSPIMEAMGIYAAVCLKTNKVYIGSAGNCLKRHKSHLHDLKLGRNSRYFQNAWNKYGSECFEWGILEIVEDEAQLETREEYWIIEHKAFDTKHGYNIMFPVSRRIPSQRMTQMKKRISKTMAKIADKGALTKRSNEHWAKPEAREEMSRRVQAFWDSDPISMRNRPKAPPRETTRFVTISGTTKPLKEWAAESGMPYGLLLYRVSKGYDLPEIFAPSFKKYRGHRPSEAFFEKWLFPLGLTLTGMTAAINARVKVNLGENPLLARQTKVGY